MIHYILSKITAKRIELSFSPEYMATCLKITPDYYKKLETGESEMSIKMMHDILEILEIDINTLFNTNAALRKA